MEVTFKWDPNSEEETGQKYEIQGQVPTFNRGDFIGRGTTCWEVKGSDGKKYLVKESWQSGHRTQEHVFLELAKDLRGVGRIVAWQKVCDTASFRGSQNASDPNFKNRTKWRIVMKKYGPPIHKFKNRLQFLCALVDAIKGMSLL